MTLRKIGFRAARARLCEALRNPETIFHAARIDQAKNLLESGEVTPREVLQVAIAASGNDHEEAPHHQDERTIIHIIRRRHQGLDWYVKWYCLEPNVIFISVHH